MNKTPGVEHPLGRSIVNKAAEIALTQLFERAGISVSDEEWADVIVRDPTFFSDVVLKGGMGLGDSYVEGKWDSEKIDEVVARFLRLGVYQKLAPIYDITGQIKRRVLNSQDRKGSKEVIEQHYDLPAEFYAAFLDPYFQYTCARFEGTDNLDEAQRIKMDNICKKLGLKPGDKLLDIGGGWGGLSRFAAENYGAKPTVVTLSKEQARYIHEAHDAKINVELCDYREIPRDYAGSFDAVSAVGVLEHVGHKNYPEFMKVLAANLKDGGRALVHSLFSPSSNVLANPWIDKYIFPNGELAPLPSILEAMAAEFEPTIESGYQTFEDLTPNYHPTLHAWRDNLRDSRRSGKIQISEQEYRKWVYYFMSFAGAIKARHIRVGQLLMKKAGK